MTFRIATEPRGSVTVFILSGRLAQSAVTELKRLFALQTDYRNIAPALKDVRLVDRQAVRFVIGCEAGWRHAWTLHSIYSRMAVKRKGLSDSDAIVTRLALRRTEQEMRWTSK
jgi:hypothetical protein